MNDRPWTDSRTFYGQNHSPHIRRTVAENDPCHFSDSLVAPPWTPRSRHPDDNPAIGLLLCTTRNHLVAEYALSGIGKPIGIAEYQFVRALSEPIDNCLPSIEEIEAELGRGWEDGS